MKTISQFVHDRITSLADLQAALQTAMQLEFSTIPPYLCAEWSIDEDADPGKVRETIRSIAAQEMSHFAWAGNMLTAIKGTPNIAHSAFVWTYPTNMLPGGVFQKLTVDLVPLTWNQIQVFMQIEYPEFPPIAFTDAPATIGAFYSAIADGFNAVTPAIEPNARFLEMGEARQISSIDDALAAIATVKGEGEGTPGSPHQPPLGGTKFAHYYLFKEIFVGRRLAWCFTGEEIPFPGCFNFQQSAANPSPSVAFNQAFTKLLIDLQTCWNSDTPVPKGKLTSSMFHLRTMGQELIQKHIRPEFLWAV